MAEDNEKLPPLWYQKFMLIMGAGIATFVAISIYWIFMILLSKSVNHETGLMIVNIGNISCVMVLIAYVAFSIFLAFQNPVDGNLYGQVQRYMEEKGYSKKR